MTVWSIAKNFATAYGRSAATIALKATSTAYPRAPTSSPTAIANAIESARIVIELRFQFKNKHLSKEIVVRLSDVKKARGDESPAPWDIGVTILWGGQTTFDHPLSGADPLHAIELAVQYARKYLSGRAQDEGGTLEPSIIQV
jgi:hypothetical protein